MTRDEFEAAVKALWPDAVVTVDGAGYLGPFVEAAVEREEEGLLYFEISVFGEEPKALAAALAAVKGAGK